MNAIGSTTQTSRQALVESVSVVGQKTTEAPEIVTTVEASDISDNQTTAVPASAIFAAKTMMANEEVNEGIDAGADVFANITRILVKGNQIDYEALGQIAKLITETKTAENAEMTLVDLAKKLADVKDLTSLKEVLSKSLSQLNPKALETLKNQMQSWVNILQNNPAVLFINHLSPKEFVAMAQALEKTKADDSAIDPRLNAKDFEKLQTQLANIIQQGRINPNADLVSLYAREISDLKLPKALIQDTLKAMKNHDAQKPKSQEESVDFMQSIASKLSESIPYAVVPALVSLCTSMLSWIPLIGQPIAQMASAISQPLMSVMVAQMASNKGSKAPPPLAKGSVA